MTLIIVWAAVGGAIAAWIYAWLKTWYARSRGEEPLWKYLVRKARRE